MQMTEMWHVVNRDPLFEGDYDEFTDYEAAKAFMDDKVENSQWRREKYAYAVERVTTVVWATSSGCAR